jgi:hypothetical protein
MQLYSLVGVQNPNAPILFTIAMKPTKIHPDKGLTKYIKNRHKAFNTAPNEWAKHIACSSNISEEEGKSRSNV